MLQRRTGLLTLLLALPSLLAADPIYVYPSESIQEVVVNHPAGTQFILMRGVHRLQEITPKDGNVFTGKPGAILSGSRQLTSFEKSGAYWVAKTQDKRTPVHGICEKTTPNCGLSEDLFIDDVILKRVTKLGDVNAQTWYLDYGAGRIYLGQDPGNKKVEISVMQHAFSGSASNVTIRGLLIEKYAAPAQEGAIHAREGEKNFSNNWAIEGNEIRFNHGSGIRVGNGTKVVKNFIHHNGQLGIGEAGSDVLIEANEIAYNNAAGFDATWEAGGVKLVGTQRLVVRNNFVHDNAGSGLWTDIDAMDTLYLGNTVTRNAGPGIHHEISYKATIQKNIVKDNGLSRSDWLWGAQILIQNSRNVEVLENTVEIASASGNGITVINQDRGSGPYGSHDARDNYIHHNQITYVGSTQGRSGLVADHAEDATLVGNNKFDHNTYHVPTQSGSYWQWQDAGTWAAFQRSGNEVNGKRVVYATPAGTPAK